MQQHNAFSRITHVQNVYFTLNYFSLTK